MMRFVTEYALHVIESTGEELRFEGVVPEPLSDERPWMLGQHLPNYPRVLFMHHVRVLECDDGRLVEELAVPNVKIDCGQIIICPPPHGRGWTLQDESSDNRTIYRRLPPDGGQQRRLTLDELVREWRAEQNKKASVRG